MLFRCFSRNVLRLLIINISSLSPDANLKSGEGLYEVAQYGVVR